MKIRFLDNTNIRIDPSNLSIPAIGIVFGGVEIEVENSLYNGESIDGIHTYFRDSKGWYYWSGKVAIVHDSLPTGKSTSIPQSTNQKPYEEQILIRGSNKKKWISSNLDTLVEEKQESKLTEIVTENIEELKEVDSRPREGLPPPKVMIKEEAVRGQTNFFNKRQQKIKTFANNNLLFQKNNAYELFYEKLQLTGENIRVGILDTGLNLSANIDFNKIIDYKNFITANEKPEDQDGQGTFNAELIAGQLGAEYIGIAPEVDLIIGKIRERVSANLDYNILRNAINWVINYGAKVVLICGGVPEHVLSLSQKNDLKQLIQRHTQKGVLFINAIGDSTYIKPVSSYPAAIDECLAVGAHGRNMQRLSNSMRSPNLDILAPGGTAFYPFKQSVTGPAAAYVTGFIALMQQLMNKFDLPFNAYQLIELIQQTAISLNKEKTMDAGYGIIYLEGILEELNLPDITHLKNTNY